MKQRQLPKYVPSKKPDIDTEKINTTSIESKVNLEKEMTLNVEISETVEEEDSQQSVEYVKPLSTTKKDDSPL